VQVNDLKHAVLWLTSINHANKGDMPRELPAGVLDPKVNGALGSCAARDCHKFQTPQTLQPQRCVQLMEVSLVCMVASLHCVKSVLLCLL
jgi:hypothetical protein